MKLSVVIVNYNVEYFLEQCLHSVQRAMQGIEGEVFVVDNNSVDGSLKMLAQKFPEVKVIANKDNVGFAKANNQAIRISTGEYVARVEAWFAYSKNGVLQDVWLGQTLPAQQAFRPLLHGAPLQR